jgi:hypothetical protein
VSFRAFGAIFSDQRAFGFWIPDAELEGGFSPHTPPIIDVFRVPEAETA